MPGRGTASGAATWLSQGAQANTCPAWMDDCGTGMDTGTRGGWGRMLLRVGKKSWGLLAVHLNARPLHLHKVPMSAKFPISMKFTGSQAKPSSWVCCRCVTCLHIYIYLHIWKPRKEAKCIWKHRNYHWIKKTPNLIIHILPDRLLRLFQRDKAPWAAGSSGFVISHPNIWNMSNI